MSNEELILQGIKTLQEQFLKQQEDIQEVKKSNVRLENKTDKLEKTTDMIAMAVAEQQIDMGEVKEKVTKIEKDVEIIKNVQDDIVGKYGLLNQERMVMSVDVKDHEERIVKLEQGGVVMGVKMAV